MRPIWIQLLIIVPSTLGGLAAAHGLIEDPPARNWYCGAITKPDEVANNVAEFPECGAAFAASAFTDGYQFMSVLTHDVGRAGVTPLPETVCSFASETFNGAVTPWDAAIDWPTTTISPGRQEIKWNIQWGPHFDDTEEFRYWITRADFQFDPAKALTWDDFEAQAFCVLTYDDTRPNANPDVIPLKETTQFRTFCTIPERQGRHVIYGEWGRNHYTFERFHGCIDVVFDGGSATTPPVTAAISQPDIAVFTGDGTLTLDASNSSGDDLSYLWSIDAPNSGYYSIAEPDRAVTVLTLAEPDSAQNVELSLLVSNADDSATAAVRFRHEPDNASAWVDLGLLTNAPLTLEEGDAVQVRTVSSSGTDAYYPVAPLILAAGDTDPEAWPVRLADAVNSSTDGPIAVGLLGPDDHVSAIDNATANRIYRRAGADVTSAFLQVEYAADSEPTPAGDCTVSVRDGANPWWAGMDIATDAEVTILDFSATGLDLSYNLIVDPGNFSVTIDGQTLRLTKPFWVTTDLPGYLGFNANNNAALANFATPGCTPQ